MILTDRIRFSDKETFIQKVTEVSKKLGVDPNWLMLIMVSESGLSPSITNSIGAVGLIQFMPSTCAGLGISPEQMASLTATQQMDYVYRYFAPQAGNLKSFYDLYLYTFFPLAIGKPDSWVLSADGLSAGSIAAANGGFDLNKDNQIKVGEFKNYLKTVYLPSLKLSKAELNAALRNNQRMYLILGISAAIIMALAYYIYTHPKQAIEIKNKVVDSMESLKDKITG